MTQAARRVGGGGGIARVSRLPAPKKGRIVYVKADYAEGSEYYSDADFDIQITAAEIRGDYHGYARTPLGNVRAGGAMNPEVSGVIAVWAEAARHLTVTLAGDLINEFGTGNAMEVRIGNDSYTLNWRGGGEWRSGDKLPRQWGVGEVVTIRIYRDGTNDGITKDGNIAAAGDVNPATITGTVVEDFYYVDPVLCDWVRGLGVPVVDELPEPRRPGAVVYVKEAYIPLGPYRAQDFDLTVTPAALTALGLPTQRIGYSAGDLQSVENAFGVGAAGGALAPQASIIRGLFAQATGRGRLILVLTDAARDEYREGRANQAPIRVHIGATTYDLVYGEGVDPGETGFWTGGNIANADQWVAGTPVTLRITTPDGQTGITPEGFKSIGDSDNPRNPTGDEVEADFYHVDPASMEWVRGLGGGTGAYFFVPTSANPRYGVEVGVRGTDPGWKWKTTLVADLAATGVLTLDEDLKTVTLAMSGAVTAQQLVTALEENAGGVLESAVITAGTTSNEILAPRSVGEVEHFYFYREPLVAQAFNEAEKGGGIPAAILRQTDDNSLGLMIGLARADAGPGWNLNARALQAAEAIGAEVDVANKEITIRYAVASTLAQIKAALNDLAIDADTTLYVEEIHDTDLTKAAIAVATVDSDFLGFFPRGAGQTDAELRGRITGMLKPFAQRGGPVVPEDEIDPAIARDAELQVLVDRLNGLTFSDIGGQVGDSQVPGSFTRDAEITKSFLLGIIGITEAQLNDLFVGAVVTGTGAGRAITVTQKDGTTIRLAVPDTGDGGGGGGGGADGHVTAAAFSADGMTLTLTLSSGGDVVASIPGSLRQAGLSQAQVQALIDAAEADDLDAADVAIQISEAIADSANALTALAPIDFYSSANLQYPVPQGAQVASGNIAAGTIMRMTPADNGDARFLVRFGGADTRVHAVIENLAGGQFYVTSVGGAADGNQDGGRITSVTRHGNSFIVQVNLFVDQTVPFGFPVSVRIVTPIVTPAVLREALEHQTAIDDIAYESAARVRTATVNYIIGDSEDNLTFVKTGGIASRVSLPSASGAIVHAGFSLVLANISPADLSVAPDGGDTINGTGGLQLGRNEAIRIQKIENGKWQIIADTRGAAGGGEDAQARAAAAAAQDLAEAAGRAAMAAADRLAELEHKTSDIDVIVDAAVWGAAPAADFQVTLFAPGNAIGNKVWNGTFVPTDLAGSEVWSSALNTAANEVTILGRVKKGYDPLSYRYTVDGVPETIHGHDLLASDDDWDYYRLGRFATGLAIALQKRTNRTHTRFGGELYGRALDQVGDHVVFGSTLIGRGNYDVTVAKAYALQANSADITIPEEGSWAIVNFGTYAGSNTEDGQWFWINLDKLRSKVAAYGGNADTGATGLVFPGVHTSSDYDMFLGVDANRKLLVSSSHAAGDPVPLEIRLVASGDVPSGTTGPAEDTTARQAAAAAKAAADAAQLAADTVITLNDALIAGKTDGQNLEFSIRHPVNAYRGANVIAVTIQGTTRYGQTAYNPASPQQAIQVGLQQTELRNLANNNRLDAGDFVQAQVRFQVGNDDTTAVFVRNIEIPVRAGVPRRFETAVGASGSAGNVPAGTYELSVMLQPSNNADARRAPTRVLLSDIPENADLKLFSRGDGSQEIAANFRYAPGTRTLTYVRVGAESSPSQSAVINVKAIGAA